MVAALCGEFLWILEHVMKRFGTGSVATMLAVVLVTMAGCERNPTHSETHGAPGAARAVADGALASGSLSVGELHNAAMDAVFHALTRANRNGTLSPRAGCEIARAAVVNHLREFGLGNRHELLMGDGFSKVGCRRASTRNTELTVQSYGTSYTSEIIESSGLSYAAKNSLHSINGAATSEILSVAQAQEQIWMVEQQASAVLAPAEAEIVSATASVAASSLQYWTDNFQLWYTANGGGLGGPPGDDVPVSWITASNVTVMGGGWGGSVKRVVAGDVGGAVAGAVAGAFAGGVGAGPGALAGAAGGSAGAATLELLSRIF
jgi:hypothetical protein